MSAKIKNIGNNIYLSYHNNYGGYMEKEDINVLDELNKGACMGRDAINFVMDKVVEPKLKEELEIQKAKYQEVIDKIAKLYPKYSDDEPHKTTTLEKMMTNYGIKMKTLTDDTTSKIAELLMQGTNMGIIEGRRLLNQKKCDRKVKELLSFYVEMQETAVENLKVFL